MNLFNRAIRIFLLIATAVATFVTLVAAVVARSILSPGHHSLRTTPDEVGLTFSPAHFPAREDGVRLSGWFVPAEQHTTEKRPTIIMLHGWAWTRLGEKPSGGINSKILRTRHVDLLKMAKSLHDADYNVLMFDLRNHGESAQAGAGTFGINEANDLLGAIDYVNTLPEVDPARVGALGFSSGANTLLYALARTDQLKAAVAVQPTSPGHFASRIAYDVVGPLGKLIVLLIEWFVVQGGGVGLSTINPRQAAQKCGANTDSLYPRRRRQMGERERFTGDRRSGTQHNRCGDRR